MPWAGRLVQGFLLQAEVYRKRILISVEQRTGWKRNPLPERPRIVRGLFFVCAPAGF